MPFINLIRILDPVYLYFSRYAGCPFGNKPFDVRQYAFGGHTRQIPKV